MVEGLGVEDEMEKDKENFSNGRKYSNFTKQKKKIFYLMKIFLNRPIGGWMVLFFVDIFVLSGNVFRFKVLYTNYLSINRIIEVNKLNYLMVLYFFLFGKY